MIEEVADILSSYDLGHETWTDAMNGLLFLAPAHRIADIIASLPEPWAREFVQWAKTKFDNDIPLDQFVLIEPMTSGRDLEPIRLFREWIRQQR